MKLSLDDIKDKETGKIGIVAGLGPSLREFLPELEDISKNNKDKTAFYCCNLFNSMTAIETDYWVVCNSQEVMKLKNAYERYNSQPDSIFLFSSIITGFEEDTAAELIKTDYIALGGELGDKTDLPLYTQNYTSADDKYGAVYSVIIHQIALAIITGCKEVYISGVDLDYSGGYAKNGIHDAGVNMGRIFMNTSAKADTLRKISYLKSCAKNVGCELYSLNESSPLSQILEVKNIENIKKNIK